MSSLLTIREFVINDILKGESDCVSDDTNLIETGMITSLSMMRLSSFIEDNFDIDIGVSDPRTYFTSIRNITNYVDEKRHEK